MEGSPYHCPKCQADSTQSIKMLFQTGVQHGVSRTAMSGVGFSGGGIGIAVGSASTSTSSSMALIRKYTMPPRPTPSTGRRVAGWLFLGIGGIIGFAWWALKTSAPVTGDPDGVLAFSGMMWAGSLILGAALLATYPGHEREVAGRQAAWDKRHAYLDRTWVCFRCGAEWQPES